MKLQRISLGDMVCVHLGKDNGSGVPRSDLRESDFAAIDGWDLEVNAGVFRLWREGMPEPVYVDPYGNSWVEAVEVQQVAVVPAKKVGKR